MTQYDDRDDIDEQSAAARVQAQRAQVVDLARAGQFDQLPAAHQTLRQMEDVLKQVRQSKRPPV